MRDGDEKRLKLLFGFAFISGHKIGGLSRRSYDYLNTPKNAIIKKKNPKEYLDKLIFHKKIKKFSEYLK